MSFTFDAMILFSAFSLAGITEFAIWCYTAPLASDSSASSE